MKNKKIAGVFFILGVLILVFYLLYEALPMLIMFASNILYLGISLIVFILFLVGFFKAIKWFFK